MDREEEDRPRPLEIVSGGQTGVDRAALDAAIRCGLPHGGWCPKGRRAEDGPIPARYRLSETDTPRYDDRTRRNVIESDATLILFRGELSGGTELTYRLALREGRRCLAVDLAASPDPLAVREWLLRSGARRLNVAGPRESQRPGIHAQSQAFLERVLETFAQEPGEAPRTADATEG